MRSHPVPYHPQLSHPHPGKTPSSVGPGLPSRGLTLDEQVGGVHRLPLDAVCTAGVGASVLPTDRCHRQAALTHLEPRRRIQLPPWAPSTPSQVEGASGPVHWPLGHSSTCLAGCTQGPPSHPPQGSRASTATTSGDSTHSVLQPDHKFRTEGRAVPLACWLAHSPEPRVGAPPHRLQVGSCFCTCDAGITHLLQSQAYICPVGAKKWEC